MTFANQLKVNEIFYSLQGESVNSGLATVFVRLSGCPLRCNYCDTSYAFYKGKRFSIAEIISAVADFPAKRVCITGGEPLAQPLVILLMQQLCDLDYQVSLETSGALDISQVDSRVFVVLDLKTPTSGEVDKNLWSNLAVLRKNSQVKMVVCNRLDFDWAVGIIRKYSLIEGSEWLLSPMTPGLEPADLAEWLLACRPYLPARMQIQLHKVLWNDVAGK